MGLRGSGSQALSTEDAIAATQAEVFPYDLNLFRTEARLRESLSRLDTLWQEIRNSNTPSDAKVVRSREAAAMVATARWMYRSGLQRTETRGMHKRLDYPQLDPQQQHYWISGGLDQVWVKSALNQHETNAVNQEFALR